jgi:hypothetical protein
MGRLALRLNIDAKCRQFQGLESPPRNCKTCTSAAEAASDCLRLWHDQIHDLQNFSSDAQNTFLRLAEIADEEDVAGFFAFG